MHIKHFCVNGIFQLAIQLQIPRKQCVYEFVKAFNQTVEEMVMLAVLFMTTLYILLDIGTWP